MALNQGSPVPGQQVPLQQQQPRTTSPQPSQQQKPGRSRRVYAQDIQTTSTNPPTPPPKTEPNLQTYSQVPGSGTAPYQQNNNNNQQQPHGGYPYKPLSTTTDTPTHSPAPVPPPKNKIDPNQIPAPTLSQMKDQGLYLQHYYGTCSKESMPLACTDFKAIDQGNCNPRFMRSTLKEIPQTADLLRDTHLPFGLVVQPLAKLHQEDEPVICAPTSEEGPVRCHRCKAYINPWCVFIDAGRKFTCNLCGFNNDVPEDYYSPLDMTGRRMDMDQRPELQRGTIEFQVPREYWTREPSSLHIVFAIDVTWSAIQSGMLLAFCETLKAVLYQDNILDPQTKIAIITYDTSVHFYNLKASLAQASMMVVSDLEDIFLPLNEGFFVDPQESRHVIEELLDTLPTLFANNKIPSAVLLPTIKSVLMALKPTGGKLCIMQTLLPSFGPGALKNRDDVKLYGTDKEKQLYTPQDDAYYNLGKECVADGVCIDLWLFPLQAYVDVSTLGVLSALTGGDTHYFPDFDKNQSGDLFAYDLRHSLEREQGSNGALRLRCSNGLAVKDHYGNFYMNNATDIELGGIDKDKSFGFSIGYDGKLTENGEAYFQCALLYTTRQGQRRVRIHNLSVPVTTTVGSTFKQADFDTAINLITKRVITDSTKQVLTSISNELDDECVKILTAYRKHCASSAAPGQLILPESFKMLPLITLSLKKSPILRKGNTELLFYSMRKLKSLGVSGTIKSLYPTMIQLDVWVSLNPEKGDYTSVWPLERLSYSRLRPHGIYMIDADEIRYIWIGRDASAEHLQGLFGVNQLDQINPHMLRLPTLDNTISQRYHDLLDGIENQRLWKPRLQLIRQGMDIENEFIKVLVEDDTFGLTNYVDHLCLIHKRIQTELERDKHENYMASTSYWAHRY
ncbi:hypothetical protein BC941DRAFT_350091 [Chlamydoabsidia padenii]|nr:hypothetical protein BC941DRAFT_350091 [Chlamydoabsidia padenii]